VVTSLTALQQEMGEIRSVGMIADPHEVIAVVEVPDVDALGDLATKNIKHRQDSNLPPREARMIISPSKYFMKIQLSPS
jgi:hypothetical protein